MHQWFIEVQDDREILAEIARDMVKVLDNVEIVSDKGTMYLTFISDKKGIKKVVETIVDKTHSFWIR